MTEQDLQKKIEDLEKHIQSLEKDLIHDPLTFLKTRAFFEEECDTYLSAISKVDSGKRKNWFGFKNLSVIFFDIDHFKEVNDTYGHAVGDEVLLEVARIINKSVREGDTVARWGGEEIVACLLGANEKDAHDKAENIRKNIEILTFGSKNLKITISSGVASNFPGATCKDLLKNADLALYKAKRSDRNKVVVFSELKE